MVRVDGGVSCVPQSDIIHQERIVGAVLGTCTRACVRVAGFRVVLLHVSRLEIFPSQTPASIQMSFAVAAAIAHITRLAGSFEKRTILSSATIITPKFWCAYVLIVYAHVVGIAHLQWLPT